MLTQINQRLLPVCRGRYADGVRIRVVASHKAMPRVPALGETWTVDGGTTHHPRYGKQVRATRCRWHLREGRLLTQYLTDNPAFVELGSVKARRLWATLGVASRRYSIPAIRRSSARASNDMATRSPPHGLSNGPRRN